MENFENLSLNTVESVMKKIGATSHYDWRLAKYDIYCSQAHLQMLNEKNLINNVDYSRLKKGLEELQKKIELGNIEELYKAEDVHIGIESQLQLIVGDVSGHLGMARARNDVAVTALKLWIRNQIDEIQKKMIILLEKFQQKGYAYAELIMPGFSHMQVAQPITFGHLCLAYGETFMRDVERLNFARNSLKECPLGAGALAGTSFSIDRDLTSEFLGFERPSYNSIDSVAERGFAIDFLNAASSVSLNLSRLSAEIVYWSSQPVGLVRLPDELVTGSVAMPHKRNPDSAELVRAKCGRIIGNLNTLQIVLKGLPLSYFRDLQEDKEPVFDTAESLHMSIDTAIWLVDLMEPQVDRMNSLASTDYITSSDFADWLSTNFDIPFKESHQLVGKLVQVAQLKGCTLGNLPPADRALVDPRFLTENWPDITAEKSVWSRTSFGGTSPNVVRAAALDFKRRIEKLKIN